jgi:hypothetical protein
VLLASARHIDWRPGDVCQLALFDRSGDFPREYEMVSMVRHASNVDEGRGKGKGMRELQLVAGGSCWSLADAG